MKSPPYPGLRPYQIEESDIFFGREEHTDQLIKKLGEKHFLAVVGSSGCGKSSLVYAGMLAGLEIGFLPKAGVNWQVAAMRPGNEPFTRLAKSLLEKTDILGQKYRFSENKKEKIASLKTQLRQDVLNSLHELLEQVSFPKENNLLLLIDQFEEIFRYYKNSPEEAAAFVSLLLAGSQHERIYVVITMRSDFLGDCATFYGLPETLNDGLFLTPRLTSKQLERVIAGPANVYDGRIDPSLIAHLLKDMGNDPDDQLPLLQHALMRMWILANAQENSENTTLTLKYYDQVGTLKTALSQHLDEIYDALDSKQQKIIKILFCSLCNSSEGTQDIRYPTELYKVAELADISWQELIIVVEEFRQEGRRFLMPRQEDADLSCSSMLDISHESLIRQWQHLQKWLKKEEDSIELYRRLEDTACRWKEDRAELWSGIELELALKWYHQKKPTVIWAKRYGKEEGKYFNLAMDFLEASKKEREKQREEKIRQLKLQKTRKQLAGASIGLAIATALAIWANLERENAIAAKQRAESIEKQRTVDLFESHLTHATLLAKNENYDLAKNILDKTYSLDSKIPQERRQTRNSFAWYAKLISGDPQQVYQVNVPLFSVALSSDGQFLAAAGEKGTLALFDANSHQLIQNLQKHTGDISAVIFHPQGQWLASAGDDKQIILWSLSDKEPIRKWKTPESILALAVNSNGTILASGGDGKDNNISLWETKTGKLLNTLIGHQEEISSLAFSSDDKWLASGSYDDTAYLWKMKTGEISHILTGHTNDVESVTFSPDNKLLTTSSDKNILLWNTETGEQVQVLDGHKDIVFGVRFIDGGRSLASVSDDITLRIWNTQSGETMRLLQKHTAGITDIATFGREIFTASSDGSVMRWDSTFPHQHFLDLSSEPASTSIAPDGEKVAVGFKNGALHLYALSNFKTGHLLWDNQTAHQKKVKRLAFSPDSQWLVSASFDDTAKLWRVTSSKNGFNLEEKHTFYHKGAINDVVFSSDNHTFATASFDGRVGLFTIDGQEQFYQPFDGKDVNSVSLFNKKRTQLLTTGDDEIRLWDINNGLQTLLQKYSPTSDALMYSSLSPNGKKIVSVGRDLKVHVYSTTDKSIQSHLSGHTSTIYRAIFSDDGQRVSTISADATLRFWDLSKGNELFSIQLPAKANEPVPAWDFDFRCTEQNCWVAVPLTRGKLILYDLGKIEK
ncbi:hypothetical protein [Candidatus Parabeggiatoa sp. HSG14]|uniref:NACHT and WD repeat domain-containing protein n=1 Tax=Candidatus Parabeggiatoa sp. HSG14 TaxID=3055593 RepID=UPI0025A7CC9B|nr:hypothetical protein [Thiotrichales bacterium HSG14]